jgi:hypothetical protein
MRTTDKHFELPKQIEHHLAALSKLYAREDQKQKQELLVNAHVRIHEEWSSDNWDGGIYGHALYLAVPEDLYLAVVRQKAALQSEIKSDINKIHNVHGEFIDEVFIEMERAEDHDWRKQSGLLHSVQHHVAPLTIEHIWGSSGFRVFLSHKAEVKADAAGLKDALERFGLSAFVAHEDIHPTKEWQEEIQNALSTMDAFVALMTVDFHDSLWTDQEVGYALARGVPIIAVRLGRDPYGFIGKFQALSCSWTEAPKEIAKVLIKHPRMLDAYAAAVQNCPSFAAGNAMAELLPSIESLTIEQAQTLVSAFNSNVQVSGSYGFSGSWRSVHGDGLAAHLSRLTGRAYDLSPSGQIRIAP